MIFKVRGFVVRPGLPGSKARNQPRVITVDAAQIHWVGGDTLMIDGETYYEAIVNQVFDVATTMMWDRIEKFRQFLDRMNPAFVLEYDDFLNAQDHDDINYPVTAACGFYDLLERNGRLLDDNGAPVRVK